jgi:ppGpp synthetase/RelA/SpoT-type nucleotidyltranferase
MISREWYSRTIRSYCEVRDDYALLAKYMRKRLEKMSRDLGIYPIVMGRAKSVESFADKIKRRAGQCSNPVNEFTDLCGVRVITHTIDEVEAVADAVGREFVLDLADSENKQEKLAYREFGYLSTHFTIQLRDVKPVPGFTQEMIRRLDGLKQIRAELQLRTLAQHVWADIYHELGYKNEFQLPPRWEREFARLAALLEDCDKGFQEIKSAMNTYQSGYGAYMTRGELEELAFSLEVLQEVEPKDKSVLHRLIRAYLALEGNEKKIQKILEDSEDVLLSYQPAQRDVGVFYCKTNTPDSPEFKKGRELLESALEKDPRDIDALCSLGGAFREAGDFESAREHYRRAYNLEPTNPYVLGNYIAEELCLIGDRRVLEHFRALIVRASERCLRQAEVDVNLPWAFYDLGIFNLYLGDSYASLCFYAKGIDCSSSAWMIRSARKPIGIFIDKTISLDGIGFVDPLLKLGWWVRASDTEKNKAVWRPTSGKFQGRSTGGEAGLFNSPVLLLSGGCGGLEAAFDSELQLLRGKLGGFKGTLVSGGSRSGVAELAGDLQANADPSQLTTIGYVAEDTEKESLDERYTLLRRTDGKDFSPLEPLAFWEDFLASGGDPGAVKMIGFNGGKLAACEYRIALALGAQVAIVECSGREADQLLADPFWNQHENLHRVSLAGDDLEGFLQS